MTGDTDKTSRGARGETPTPDKLLHAGSEGEFSAEDLVLASGRDLNPKNLAWAERRMERKGARASLDELLP
ncbi:hypothetical protein ABZ990_23215 [Streptomyces sp. NPDC046203]|uniref:hypothetical protein n=1 Tax=Streptomyces sp. NPDC046203 TaxID=3154602 RepID=UPI0033EB0BCF